MASIEKRLREWAITIWDRELDEEDKDILYDELLRAADEIEELAKENKELRDERDVDHDANVALYSALEEERKKHEWISVKDKWPEEGVWVLCIHEAFADAEHTFKDKQYDKIWSVKAYGEYTHWMPLPEPPKEEK